MSRCISSRPPTHAQPDIIMIIFIAIHFFLLYIICIHLCDPQLELRCSTDVCVHDEFYNLTNYYANVYIKTCLQGVPAISIQFPQVSQEPFVNESCSVFEAARRSILLQFVISSRSKISFSFACKTCILT